MPNNFQAALQNVIVWIVASSANPGEVSLTVKGALVGIVPTLLAVAGLAHVSIGSDQLTTFVDALVTFIQGALTVVASLMAIYGIFRKVYYTIVTPPQA